MKDYSIILVMIIVVLIGGIIEIKNNDTIIENDFLYQLEEYEIIREYQPHDEIIEIEIQPKDI